MIIKSIIYLLLVVEGSEERRSKQTPIDGALVHQDGVLLVVARVHHDGHDHVHPRRQLSEVKVLHRAGGHERFLRVVQHVSEGVHPKLCIKEACSRKARRGRGRVGDGTRRV